MGAVRHDTAEDPELKGALIGRFRIRERVGAGGMGEVFSADDTRLQRLVALKRIAPGLQAEPQYRERLLREAQRASQLSDPHVAAIYDVLEQGAELYLVMEYVPGKTLRAEARTRLSISDAVKITRQCALALQAAHAAGILHCDIKPENIMVAHSAGGLQVKVLDFGIARILPGPAQAGSASTLDAASVTMSGTAGYMAPELLRGQLPDARADIFSLGVVFYELLAGENPFRAETLFSSAERILNASPPPLCDVNPQVSAHLQAVVATMLAKDRKQRYANAEELLQDLRMESDQGQEAPGPRKEEGKSVPHAPKSGAPEPASAGPWRGAAWRKRWWLAAGCLLLVAALLMARRTERFRRWLGGNAVAAQNVAVLPFDAPAGDSSSHALSDGLAATVAAKLTQVGAGYPIQVVSPAEVREQGVTTMDQARKLLGATLVLTGSLRVSGDQVRINYRLVDTTTLRELRGDAITASRATGIFTLEDQVVESVLGTLAIALAPKKRQLLAADRSAAPQAYDFYLQGRGYLQNFHKPEEVENALEVFRHALQLDPRFAPAYAGLGEAHLFKYDLTQDAKWLEGAESNCERAASLDPAGEEAHICLGMVGERTGQYDRAAAELERALELAPGNADAYRWLASVYESKNDLARAEATFKRAISQRPNSWSGYNSLGGFYFHHQRYDEAAAMFSQVISLTPDNFLGYSNLGGVYLARGDFAHAIAQLERSAAIRPSSDAFSNLGTAYFYQRQFAAAAAAYERAAALSPQDQVVLTNLAEADYWAERTGGSRNAEATARALHQAMDAVREALRVNPRNAEALQDGALCAALLGDRRQAEEFLARAFAAAPNDSDTLFRAAVVRQLFGRTEDALALIDKARAAGCAPQLIAAYPAFDALQNDPRFRKLMQR
jgi:serine/threonine-protein kinase